MTSSRGPAGDCGGCHHQSELPLGKRKISRRERRRPLAVLFLLIMAFIAATDGQTTAAAGGDGGGEGEGGDGLPNMGVPPDFWRTGYEGHGTTHEQVGQVHFPKPIYTKFNGFFNYSRDLSSTTKAVNPIYNFTHFIFGTVMTDEPALPPGYIMVQQEKVLVLGKNVERNEWSLLMSRYWLVLFFVIFLLAAIIVIPFIAVCYCCFCCCLRCKQGCIRCMAATDRRRRMCCGICLFLLIIGLIFGLLIAFVTNKFLHRGLQESMVTMRRSSEDTCTFLRNVADHIHHLLVFNFQELEMHLIEQINDAHNHIFLDLADASDSNALIELERILDSMPLAHPKMKQLEYLEKELRFYMSNLRDSIRGLKRDMTYTVTHYCGNTKERCYKTMAEKSVLYMDTSTCLHLDELPNTTVYVEAVEMIIKKRYNLIPKLALVRFNKVREKIKEQMELVGPPLKRTIATGHSIFDDRALKIRNMIDAIISDIHLNTMRSTKTFDDVYEKFGTDRRTINIICITLIFIIIVFLFTSLVCGVGGYSRTHPGPSGFCSKGMAASCLLIAIILIFCVFSFITMVGVFYFMIGLVTYEGACAPTTQDEKYELFRQLDAVIDMNRYLRPTNPGDEWVMPPLHMSEAVRSCRANESIFQLLRTNNIYDINDLANIILLPDIPEEAPVFTEDLTKLEILTESEKILLNKVRNSNLSTYHSMLYDQNLCLKLSNNDLEVLANVLLEDLATDEAVLKIDGRVHSILHKYSALAYHKTFYLPVQRGIKKALKVVKEIDTLILYLNHDFGNSIEILLTAVINAENFVRKRGAEYVNNLGYNLTSAINEQVEEYINMVITEANNKVGLCQPLAYIYYEGVYFVCSRLVDPINGFWLGLLLCSILLLPTLVVCHRLMCLYLKIYPAPTVAAVGSVTGRCPTCTGDPYVPIIPPKCGNKHDPDCRCAPCRGIKHKAPTESCGRDHDPACQCPICKGAKKSKRGRGRGGAAPEQTAPMPGPVAEMMVISEAPAPSKHKKD